MSGLTPKRRIVVLGGGFAGLWSAAGAARQLDALGIAPHEVGVTLVSRDAWHAIRVRNYESDLRSVRVPLDTVLAPIGVERVEAVVQGIDLRQRTVHVQTAAGPRTLAYERLVFALGSELVRPALAGLAEHAFDVDTFAAADRLDAHLRGLPSRPAGPGQYTVVVIGAGLCGIEVAAELPGRLRAILEAARAPGPLRVVLADGGPRIGSNMGEGACRVIEQALGELGVQTRTGVSVLAIDVAGVVLAGGETIPAATTVWCAGMRAHPLTRLVPVEHDRLGRLPVDARMQVQGVADVFAAGDAAWCLVDGAHASVMSCQHSRPMGRFAGHNVVCDLFGLPMLALDIGWYVTVLDLGAWGAVYTQSWDRVVATTGAPAKRTKQTINRQRIYPPLTGSRREILDAAAPVVEPSPALYPAPTA